MSQALAHHVPHHVQRLNTRRTSLWWTSIRRLPIAAALCTLLLLPALAPAATAAPVAPGWKILVLIYERTDFSFSDGATNRRVVGQMTTAEKQRAVSSANAFVKSDIPALTTLQMIPSLEIRYPGTIRDLEPFCGWWPAPWRIAADLDPAFDSVIVIWDSSGTDVTSGQPYHLQNCGGLTLPSGTGQTFSTFQVDSIPTEQQYNRNIFKHEWGHSILFYYGAAGTAPQPEVDNHTAHLYVNCDTGRPYVLQDETLGKPILNSIYNNRVGFTRDYYSGRTALAGTTTCLGITGAAWASGGPVSKPGGPRLTTATAASAPAGRMPIRGYPPTPSGR